MRLLEKYIYSVEVVMKQNDENDLIFKFLFTVT